MLFSFDNYLIPENVTVFEDIFWLFLFGLLRDALALDVSRPLLLGTLASVLCVSGVLVSINIYAYTHCEAKKKQHAVDPLGQCNRVTNLCASFRSLGLLTQLLRRVVDNYKRIASDDGELATHHSHHQHEIRVRIGRHGCFE